MVDTTGFVTALVINFAIALVAITLFLIWRPKYPWCYDTRRNPRRRITGCEPPTIPPGGLNWLFKVMRLSDIEVLETSGLDALMFIKFFEMCSQLFCVLSILGVGILLPVNYNASSDVTDAFEKLSMANVHEGSDLFWVHLVLSYVFCIFFYYLAFHVWKDYMNLRHQFLGKWATLGGSRTVMIHNLPNEIRSDDALFAYFNRLFPDQVRSARMAKDLSMEKDEVNKEDNLTKNVAARNATESELEANIASWMKELNQDEEVEKSKKEKPKKRPKKALKLFLFNKVDAIDYNVAELERLNKLVETKKAEFVTENGQQKKNVPTLLSAFVTFQTVRAAITACNFVYDIHPHSFEVTMAPECRDVYWENLNYTHEQRTGRKILFDLLTALLVLFWIIPTTFAQSVSNLKELSDKYSWLSGVNDIPTVILGFIQAYGPAILLAIFLIVVPMILTWWTEQQGLESRSAIQKSVAHKYFLFVVINFFFGAIVGSSIFANIKTLFNDISSVPTVLGQTIPTVANYFVNYLGLAAFAGFPLQLCQLGRLIGGGIIKKYLSVTPRQFEMAEAAPEIQYGVQYVNHLFIFIIAITYSFISPIIIPFAAVYYVLGWVVFKYQLVHVFVQSYESGGSFWPLVYSKMSSCLFIAQICLVGIFGLKQVPAQAVLVLPLPVLTVLFDRYIHTAIKAKIRLLPLEQLVELDSHRGKMLEANNQPLSPKDVSVAKLKLNASMSASSAVDGDSKDKDVETGSLLRSGSFEKDTGLLVVDVAPPVKPSPKAQKAASPKDKLSMSSAQGTSYGALAGGPSTIQQEPTEEKLNNGDFGANVAYTNITDKLDMDGFLLTARPGFPYAPSQQDRAYVEGDVAEYVQPELTRAVPARIEVHRAKEYLSTAAGNDGQLNHITAASQQV